MLIYLILSFPICKKRDNIYFCFCCLCSLTWYCAADGHFPVPIDESHTFCLPEQFGPVRYACPPRNMYLHFPCHVRWLSRHQILFSTLWDNPHVPKAFSGGFLERQRRRMCRMVPCYGLCHRWDALDTVLRLSVVHEQFCPIRDAYPVCLRAADCQSEGCQPSSVVTSLCLWGVPFDLEWSMKVLLVNIFKFSS